MDGPFNIGRLIDILLLMLRVVDCLLEDVVAVDGYFTFPFSRV